MMEASGILCINKHSGVTSHDIVNKIRRIYKTKKVGHAGTLDPMATGVLVVLVGRAVKASEYATCDKKKYRATLRFGFKSDTEDVTGNVIPTGEPVPSEDKVRSVCASFLGESMQIPPMYSAVKCGGKKLYELAREGKEVERQAREIYVHYIYTEKISCDEYLIECEVSKGTYIRTLCTDIGEACGCSAIMTSLTRISSGNFNIDDTHTIDELLECDDETLVSFLAPTESLFYDYPKIVLDDFFYKLCYSGCEIYQKKIGTDYDVGRYVRLYSKEGFFALGRVYDFDGGSAIKSEKIFRL